MRKADEIFLLCCREYDLAIAFEARPDHNGFWQAAVQERSNPAVQYINTGEVSPFACSSNRDTTSHQQIFTTV